MLIARQLCLEASRGHPAPGGTGWLERSLREHQGVENTDAEGEGYACMLGKAVI